MDTNKTYHILIVEDDEVIRMVEQIYLESNGYAVRVLGDGNHIDEILREEKFDLILLDVMLPGKNGYDICKEIRMHYTMPILMVTAKTDPLDKIRGLNIGADDYITKPFDPIELVARVGANLRQFERNASGVEKVDPGEDEIVIDNIRILKSTRRVYKDGQEIKIPNREYELLAFLAEHANTIFSKEQLFEAVWGFRYMGDSATVMVHINRIRDKIERDSKKPKIIETVRGVGYRLNMREE
ncbi:MAG: response regulator transcription factor [Clostridiales bacterium]|nr:response regulator transcription factor [Clostridiales bacterium]